jgi:hypothetical protein
MVRPSGHRNTKVDLLRRHLVLPRMVRPVSVHASRDGTRLGERSSGVRGRSAKVRHADYAAAGHLSRPERLPLREVTVLTLLASWGQSLPSVLAGASHAPVRDDQGPLERLFSSSAPLTLCCSVCDRCNIHRQPESPQDRTDGFEFRTAFWR